MFSVGRSTSVTRSASLLLALSLSGVHPTSWPAAGSVFLEELTSAEVRQAIQAHHTTIIVPVGATEQNGPHMVLGKHNVRVKALAGRIAIALGDTLVAPVVAYVPEGNVSPPTSHMRFAGTISIPDAAFKSLLDGAARSFKQHGFTDVVFIGDHGGYQSQLADVAARLNRDWVATPARAHFIAAYYRVTQDGYARALRARGLSDAQIGSHAGASDTSLALAVDARLVRPDRYPRDAREGLVAGVTGDPKSASAELGQLGVDLIVAQTVAAIRSATTARR
jgi:creatinine amidohydrolase/Fe(II)-dependent formamide hydrolase-like protein